MYNISISFEFTIVWAIKQVLVTFCTIKLVIKFNIIGLIRGGIAFCGELQENMYNY